MDIISHGLWGSIVARRRSLALGFLFGILPDVLCLDGYLGDRVYFIVHSLCAFLIVTLITRKVYKTWLYGAAYLLHLLMDAVSHEYGTRPLFYIPLMWRSLDPIRLSGWNWRREGIWLEVINWAILIVVIAVLSTRKLRRR